MYGFPSILDFYLQGFSSSSFDTNINIIWRPEIILDTWLHLPIPILALYPQYTMQKSVLDLIPIPDWYESLKKIPNTNNYQV